MPIQKNLNVAPYYDDFDPNKNFYKVLYKPGHPVQARELTTQQTITADQIEQLASRFLKEGDNIIPGEVTYLSPQSYVRLSSFTQGVSAQDFVGYNLTGVTSGVVAEVVFAVEATEDDDATLYVSYSGSGGDGATSTFLEGEVLESTNPNNLTATVGVNTISKPITSNPLGQGALYKVSEGSFYVDGMMVRNTEQTIVVGKFTHRPTAEVGFLVTEEVVTSSEDASLLDNSQGSSNFAAPGADRLKITLTLVTREQNAVDPNFIRLSTITQGNILSTPGETVKWDWLYEILARRTYDESGDYIVTEFPVTPMEYWNADGEEKGLYDADAQTGLYPAVPGDEDQSGLTYNQANDVYVLNVSPGKAYVKGYEVEYQQPNFMYGNKARNTAFRADALTQFTEGYNLNITNLYGTPDFTNITGEGTSVAFDDIIIYRNFIDGFVGEAEDGNGRPLNIGNAPWKTFHIIADGDIGSNPTGYVEVYKEGNTCVVNASVDLVRGDAIGDATILAATPIEAIPAGVMRPRYLTPDGTVDLGDGFYGYNSTYNMGVMTSVYFTELDVVGVTNSTDAWTVGELVRGEDSGAVGTVESGSTVTNLLVSNVVGSFLPGEEVIQTQGATTKVSRILRPGEVSEFVFTDKGAGGTTIDLSSQTAVTLSALGSTKTLTVADGDIVVSSSGISITETGRSKLTNFPLPTLEQNLGVTYELSTVPAAVTGYAVSRGSNLTNTLQLAKSFYSPLADTNDFSADISIQNSSDSEITDVANGSGFSAAAGSNTLLCDVFSGDPSQQLIPGDLITFVDDNGNTINRIVQYATKPVGYGTKRSRARIFLTTTVPNTVSSNTVQRIRVRTKGTPTETLLYSLPQQVVATLETNPDATEISYQVKKEFIVNVPSGATTITLTTGKNNETFIASDSQTTIAIAENISNATDPTNLEGRVLVPSNIDVTQDDGRKVIYTIPNPLAYSVKMKIIAPIFVANAISKRKVLRSNETITVAAADAAKALISLGKADATTLHSITQSGKDITDNYIFDNGQRDNIYDIARVVLKNGRPAATGELQIVFDYFEHSGEGDFFSVDSYTADDTFNYANIPTYTPTFVVGKKGVFEKNKNQQKIQLRDAIDFRPVVSASTSVIASVTDGTDSQSSTNYRDSSNGGDGFVPRIPIAETLFRCDMEYYLARYDSLFLSSNGSMALISGEDSIDPEPVPDLANSIRLYDVFLPAYTFALEDIYIRKFNYKRYQMKDIAVIDRRVERLEEVVTLSLLEQAALNTSVRDAVTGLDRFKNGIVVDSFRDHSGGEVGTDQYRCSIDSENDQLRAPYFIDQAELEEKAQTEDARFNANYVIKDGIATLTHENEFYLNQPHATRWINLQPYMVFTYDGELELNPPIDTFADQNRLPALVIEDNSVFDATNGLANAMNRGGFGTVWGRWQTNGNTRTRTQTTTTINTRTARRERTSYGDRVTDVQLAETMRSIAVEFRGTNLKPETRYYAFFDEIEVSNWISPDTIQTNFDDGLGRYQGAPNRNRGGFGLPIMSDSVGTIQGIFIVPNGRAPVEGSRYNGRMRDLQYRSTGTSRSFNTGTKVLRFTDNPDNPEDLDLVGGICEADFTSSGVISDVQQTVVSTRLPAFATRTRVTDRETLQIPRPVINNITNVTNNVTNVTNVTNRTTVVNNNITRVERPQRTGRGGDPIAQSFYISFPDDIPPAEGIFVTELDIYFRTKDPVHGVTAYLVPTEAGQRPTDQIIPHGAVTKKPNTTLRVLCTSLDGNTTQLATGTEVRGSTSGAVGTLKSSTTFRSPSNNATQNVNNFVYTLIIDQYDGDFVAGEELIPLVTPRLADKFFVASDEVEVTRVDLQTFGENYTEATVTFSEPELPGGTAASASVTIADGKIYQIQLEDPGSGYTKTPTISITGDGTGATAGVRSKDSIPAVEMGVTTSDDATLKTTFKFPAPVFLKADTYYAFVAYAPASLNYTIWTAKLGENLVGTETRMTTQPLLGSLFKSQNQGLWTEDQTQDVKFDLRRAKFDTSRPGVVTLQNAPLGLRGLEIDPIETNTLGSNDDSDVFGDNPKIVRIYHHMHGLASGDLVAIEGVVNNPGGIPNEEFNTLHTVLAADFETFTIRTTTAATESVKDGGHLVACSYNRPYEVINTYTGAMVMTGTSLDSYTRSVQAAGITNYNVANAYRKNSYGATKLSESFYYGDAQQVAGYLNEVNNTLKLGGERSLEEAIVISSSTDYLSPVLDVTRTNANLVRNLIDNPSVDGDIYGVTSRTVTFSGDVSPTTLTVGDLAEFTQGALTSNLTVREIDTSANKITFTGQYVGSLTTSSTFADATLSGLTIVKVSSGTSGTFYPETTNAGSTWAKWVSRLFVFENPCDGLELKLSAIFYDTASIKVYYRPRNIGFDGELANVNWIPFNGTGLPNQVEKIEPRSSEDVNPTLIPDEDYQSLTFNIQDVPKFDGVAIKIVMTADNPAQAPLIDDLQLITTE